LTAGNAALTAAWWLLLALFVAIGCAPVMIKVLLNLGPETSYDQLLASEERMQMLVAEHDRAIRLKILRKNAEAEAAAAEQVLLAAREAVPPEIARKTTTEKKQPPKPPARALNSGEGARRLPIRGHSPQASPHLVAAGQPRSVVKSIAMW